MAIGIVGIKRGMTRIFSEDGKSVPVTVIEAEPNRVAQIKTKECDGYAAIQVSSGEVKPSNLTRPLAGHYNKANVEIGRALSEFRIIGDEEVNLGDSLSVSEFEVGQKIDVTGQSKGKGFAGVVKRHNFKMQDATHGLSLIHI